MQDQPSRSDAAADLDRMEQVALALLLDAESSGLWSVRELGQALGSEIAADDALVGLHAAGLVHRCHEFVFPTRAAVRCRQLAEVW